MMYPPQRSGLGDLGSRHRNRTFHGSVTSWLTNIELALAASFLHKAEPTLPCRGVLNCCAFFSCSLRLR